MDLKYGILNFTFYIPAGYDDRAGLKVSKVIVTTATNRILTATSNSGQEIWSRGPSEPFKQSR